ncbi:MAG: hypothetical protein DSY66_05400 [Persephonella sp.]|nr:MAG: hypothetical protein DSY53_04670 [Persephonella sp.]RUM59860.1 MAG: hypothetical protein DSY66_05400 [Persephonella sp.]
MNNNNQNNNPYMEGMHFLQNVKEETEFERILKILTIPARSGIYISRKEIREIGLSMGVEIPVKERKFMLKDLFIYAKQFGTLKDFIDLLINFTDRKINEYRELQEIYPKSKLLFEGWITRAEKLKKFLEKMKFEIDIYKNM